MVIKIMNATYAWCKSLLVMQAVVLVLLVFNGLNYAQYGTKFSWNFGDMLVKTYFLYIFLFIVYAVVNFITQCIRRKKHAKDGAARSSRS